MAVTQMLINLSHHPCPALHHLPLSAGYGAAASERVYQEMLTTIDWHKIAKDNTKRTSTCFCKSDGDREPQIAKSLRSASHWLLAIS